MRTIAALRVVSLGLVVAAAAAACSAAGGDPDSARPPGTTDGGGTTPSGANDAAPATELPGPDAGADGGVGKGAPPSILPVPYARADTGAPLSPAELQTATDELIALLKETRYFDVVAERIHGWPETDPKGGYWWGTFWTGVSVGKAAGTVTYKHSNDGTDNAGIHTSPYVEGACYAHLLWGEEKTAKLVRRITRGMTAWILAMERTAGDTSPRLLARAVYAPPVTSTEGGRTLSIDTSASRPGIDAEPSDYIHHPQNPTLGDVYVKTKRSKDDIGHMLRAIAQVQACAPRVDVTAQAELAKLQSLYEAWAKDVDARGFVIPTRDAAGNVYEPTLQLARYTTLGGVECIGTMAVRLMHAAPSSLDCGNGFGVAEATAWPFLKNDARQIVRSHHAAAVVLAWRRNLTTPGLALLQGLGDRVSKDFEFASSASPPSGFNPQDAAAFMSYAAVVGVPLRSAEVRFLHGRLHEAYVGMRAPTHAASLNVFDASVPDGTYAFDPPNVGLFHRDLGVLLGACASPYRNTSGRPLFDCARLASAFGP